MSAPGPGLQFIHRFIAANRPDLRLTLLLLHGTGGNEDDLIPLGGAVAAGAALLSPRGRVLEGGMPRFFRRLAEGIFDVPDLRARTHELASFVIDAARAYGFDPARVVAVGFSNGANIAASLLQLRPGLLAGAVLFRPMVPLIPEPLPDLAGTPVMIGAGTADPIVPKAETERLATLLRTEGAELTVRWDAGAHALSKADVEAARAWLAARFAPPSGQQRGVHAV